MADELKKQNDELKKQNELKLQNERFDVLVALLQKYVCSEEYDKARRKCVEATKIRRGDTTVQNAHVYALLNLNRWCDALQACDKYLNDESREQGRFAYERAYCLYRLNKFSESLEVLEAISEKDDGRKTKLEAQIRYRSGDYVNSAKLYDKLSKENPDDADLLVNAIASRVSGGVPINKTLADVTGKSDILESSYEANFNLACGHIDAGQYQDAESRLQQAREICIEELIESGDVEKDDPDILDHAELAAIQGQRACVLQRLGGESNCEEASKLYQSVLRPRNQEEGSVEATVQVVARNNAEILKPGNKPLHLVLVANKVSQEHVGFKLNRKQSINLSVNRCASMLRARRANQANYELEKLEGQFPDAPECAVIRAAIHLQKQASNAKKKQQPEAESDQTESKESDEDAVEVLKKYLDRDPENAEVLIALAMVHAQNQDVEQVSNVFAKISRKGRAAPHLLETMTSFYRHLKDDDKAMGCLEDAIAYWSGENGGEEDEGMLGKVLRIAARFALDIGDHAFRAEVLQKFLERIDGSDTDCLCNLVEALSVSDPERADEFAKRLQTPSLATVDPEELEMAPIPQFTRVLKAAGEGDTAKVEVKKKHKRKPRYPKGFDPENPGPPPDPERWLPKKERSDYKAKMAKAGKNYLKCSQGAMVSDDQAFRSKGPSTAQVELPKDGSSRPKGNQSRNKKSKK